MLNRIWRQMVTVVLTTALFLGSAAPACLGLVPSCLGHPRPSRPDERCPGAGVNSQEDCPEYISPEPKTGGDLPFPDPQYGEGLDGVDVNEAEQTYIGETYDVSCADFNLMVGPQPPKDAPNILLVLLDDVGFWCRRALWWVDPHPDLEKLAENGLKYNRFHTTALCAPTRAALLTGRNNHSAATGTIQETFHGFPGYSGPNSPEHGNHRPDPAGPRLCHQLVWQEPQRA